MNVSPCISRPSQFFSFENFTIGPYRKAKEHYNLFIETVLFSEAPFGNKAFQGIKHLALGILFSIPLVNIIAIIGCAILSKNSEATINETDMNYSSAPKSQNGTLQRPLLSSTLQNIQESSHSDIGNAPQKIQESFLFLSELSNQLDLNNFSLSLSHIYRFHTIHHHITRLSKFFGEQGVDQGLWFAYLKSLESAQFIYPNQTVHALKLGKEREIFENPNRRYHLEVTVPKSLNHKELEDVTAIENESFSDPHPAHYIQAFAQSPRSTIILAKHEGSVVGVLMYKDGTVTSVARRAEAVMGIGMVLFNKLNDELVHSPLPSIDLLVRPSNTAAINLYQRVGFTVRATHPNYYSYPREDAWVMSCVLATT